LKAEQKLKALLDHDDLAGRFLSLENLLHKEYDTRQFSLSLKKFEK
jgi:hypothetical protein